MNRQRIFLALILSMVVLFGYPLIYNKLFPPKPVIKPTPIPQQDQPQPVQQPFPTEQAVIPSRQPQPQPQAQAQAPAQETPQQAPREITIKTPYWNVVLSTAGATAKAWVLHHYQDNGN